MTGTFGFYSLVYHLSVIIALGAFTLFFPRERFSVRTYAVLQGLFFGSFAIAGMLNPIEVHDDVFFDGRTVLVSLCSLFFGPIAAAVSASMAIACRFYLGGHGMWTGMASILAAATIGLLYQHYRYEPKKPWSTYSLWYFGCLVHLAMLGCMLLLLANHPATEVLDLLLLISVPVLLLYPLATALLGKILTTQEEQHRALLEAREGERRLTSVLEMAPVAIAISQNDGRVSFINTRYRDLFGYDEHDIPDVESWMEKAYPDPEYRAMARAAWEREIAEATQKGLASPPREFQVRAKSGKELTLAITAIRHGEEMLVAFNDLTERKDAELAKHQSYTLLYNLTSQVPGVVYQYRLYRDGRSCFPFASEGMMRIYGVTPEEVREDATPVFSLVHPDDYDRLVREILESAASLSHFHSEFRVQLPNQDLGWRVCDSVPQRMEDGSTLWHGMITDITEFKRQEESMRLQSAALNATANAIVVTDINGVIEWVNPAFSAITQYDREDVIGKNPSELVKMPGAHDDAFYKQLWDCILSGQVWRGTLTNRRKDGSRYTEEQTITPIRDVNGKITHFVGVKQDVTERVRTESALRESQHRLERALCIGKIALWEWELETDTVYYSPEWSQHTGTASFGASGDFSEWLDRVHPDDQPLLLRDLKEVRSAAATRQREFRLRHDDGEYRWILMNTLPLLNEGNQTVRIAGTNVDVTERKHLENEFEQAQKLESVGRLAGGVAHDFNNLLSVIGGYCEMALATQEDGSLLHKDLMQIKRAADRAAGLTRQLLAFSRRQVLSPVVLNVNTILKEEEKMLHRLIGEDIRLELVIDESLGQAMMDPGQLEQVVLNLAVNARDAMPQGGTLLIRTANLELTKPSGAQHLQVPPGNYINIHVSDTGVGMPPAILDRIFEPFFTTKEAGKGTGLGLATVYGIIKQSGGDILVESEPGTGTTFDIYLPRLDEQEIAANTAPAPTITKGTERVLLVEDEDNLREIAERFLQHAGYSVVCAGSGQEALDLAARESCQFDLLLTDVIMPGMSGPGLADTLQRDFPGMKVLYMSGYTDDALANHGVLTPGIALIMKPFTMAQLTAKVRAVLEATPDALPTPS